jgi:hypothetical protein
MTPTLTTHDPFHALRQRVKGHRLQAESHRAYAEADAGQYGMPSAHHEAMARQYDRMAAELEQVFNPSTTAQEAPR